MGTRFLLKGATLAFAEGLGKKVSGSKKGAGKLAHRVKLVIPTDHPQIPEMEKVFLALCEEKWPGKAAAKLKAIKANPNHRPLKDGSLKDNWAGFDGNLFISCSSDTKPSIVKTVGGVNQSFTFEDGVVYSGCKVNAQIEFFAYDNEDAGISAGIRGVQYIGAGTRLGGGGAPAQEDEFETVSVDDADDLT